MKRSYDLIVPVYDKLVKLIYGNALRKAQTRHLSLIPASSAVLIAGGGTGWILEEITNVHRQGLYIDYVDVSVKMIEKAMKKDVGSNEVHFINQSVLSWKPQIGYDVIITPFFFDNFSESNARKAFTILHSALRTDGLWLYTDFQIAHRKAFWQKTMLYVMYMFFRATANIEANHLPDIPSQFRKYNYKAVKTDTIFHRFIITSVLKKAITNG